MNYIYILLLYFLGIGLVILETMLPGMVIGLIGFMTLISSIVLAFMENTFLGIALIVIALTILPFFVMKGFRKIQLKESISDSTALSLNHLVGEIGITLTELHPVGKAEINGKRYDVYASELSISSGKKIIVDRIEGNKIVVCVFKG
ncbi:MAG: hypothetical protein OEV44_09620 [Spirochaetota bacterium]|nr:hypothetical protein [Spirochaetota bacterium]